jgi:hypothetical protein
MFRSKKVKIGEAAYTLRICWILVTIFKPHNTKAMNRNYSCTVPEVALILVPMCVCFNPTIAG